MIWHPPYITPQIVEILISAHNRQIVQDMSHFVQFHSAVMVVRARGHNFSSALQFEAWHEIVVGQVCDVVKKEDAMEKEERHSQRKTGFEVEVSARLYVQT